MSLIEMVGGMGGLMNIVSCVWNVVRVIIVKLV